MEVIMVLSFFFNEFLVKVRDFLVDDKGINIKMLSKIMSRRVIRVEIEIIK